ncbi:Uroporphyrinogen-III C-methyltransferase [Anatilimnocola aggregata]|uniref:uroporphyrinogen-III C-methyltransferase n=1 Tax=Anatilimnocola aggregata TaxID=2528021 RepID=A0A517YBM9_9BACT|nr:uroporphyrinogen-III C-methyltransferase [Anatilimnocola aggregata]QDU27621.1 Uroporphyrinogen-III C-methyltransferase [Anatilimnocola aggregata]
MVTPDALSSAAVGVVYLVGAGPGDPGLITVRGRDCLHRADVVLYDYLSNPQLLSHCRSTAELHCLGQHGRGRLWSQAEINAHMIAAAGQGRGVVRLKCGDPTVFARAAEEIDALVAAGIPFEIVPGITAAFASASYAGIPLTQKDHASAVALVTGQESPGKQGETLDYSALARFPGTLCFYMGVTSAREWSRGLMAGGRQSTTPVALIRRCSFPDQQVWQTTLGEVATFIEGLKLRPPVIIIVGEVAASSRTWSWFEQRPLFGQRILVTRPAHQIEDLRGPLSELGAEVLHQPAIEITPTINWAPVDQAIERLTDFDWLVFSSSNGVHHFLARIWSKGHDLRSLGSLKIAAIGPGTAAELARHSLRADLIPDEFRAESLAASLATTAQGKRFLLLRASRGREVLAEELTAAGGIVEQVVVYDSHDITHASAEITSLLQAGKINWITVTSSAIARSLHSLFGDDLRLAKLASISPITTSTLRDLGHEPAAEATSFTMPGLIDAIRGHNIH